MSTNSNQVKRELEQALNDMKSNLSFYYMSLDMSEHAYRELLNDIANIQQILREL